MAAKLRKYEEQLSASKTLSYSHLAKDDRDVLYSIHQRGKQKTMWYISSWESMEGQNFPTNKELVTYRSKIYPYHALHRAVLTTVTPKIEAKSGYQIRFCNDLFINMIREYNLYLNDVHLQYGNTKSLFCELKLNNEWQKFSEELGNKDSLTSWSDKLSAVPISIYLPWFYSQDKSDNFPLKYCGHHDRLHHSIEFNLKLSELLLIKDSNDDLVDFDPSLITVSDNTDSIDIPEMEGLYSTPTKQEMSITDAKLDEIEGHKELFINSMYVIEDENDVELGKKVQIKFDSKSKQPVSEIYWAAYNKTKSLEDKSMVFYSPGDNIFSPIKFSKLETSFGTILDNKSSYKTERAYLLPFQKQLPDTPGINYYSNSVLNQENGRKFTPGLIMGGGSLTVMMKEKSLSKDNHKYIVFAALKHIRRFRFKNYPKTQEERLNMGCTIEQDDDE